MIPVIRDIISEHSQPFTVSCKRISSFPKGDHGYPVIALLQSKELDALHKKLTKAFDDAKIKYSQKFPEYKPHATLSYSKKKPKNITFKKIEWLVDSVCLYSNNEEDRTDLLITFPLFLDTPVEKSASFIYEISKIFSQS